MPLVNMQPDKCLPEVGKVYHVFNDGKITLSRHYLVKCVAVVPWDDFITDRKYKKPRLKWFYRACNWLYRHTTDYIIICEDFKNATSERIMHEDEGWDKLLYYTRTIDGGWFGFGTLLDDGVLDTDRTIWNGFYKAAHDPKRFAYDVVRLQEIEELNKY